jgi:L-threonate 2-dehydrogenase
MHTVGIIGVGNMGAAIAANLLQHGWTVHICDVVASKTEALSVMGAEVHHNAALVAQRVDLLMVCVVDALQTIDVLFGANGASYSLAKGKSVMLCPTISPQDIESIAKRLLDLGIHVLDAPMSGGPTKARHGTMSLMLACDNAVFETYKDLIHTLSSRVFRISEKLGDGARTKLVNNLLAAINLAGAAEVLALSQRMGLNVSTTLNVIEQSSGQSWICSDRMQRAIANDFEPRAHTSLLAKDSKLAIAAASALGFEASLGTVAATIFEQALACGLASEDDASLLKLERNTRLGKV